MSRPYGQPELNRKLKEDQEPFVQIHRPRLYLYANCSKIEEGDKAAISLC